MEENNNGSGLSRRDFLAMSSGVAASALIGGAPVLAAPSVPTKAKRRPAQSSAGKDRLNILYVFTDQERYFGQLPKGHSLPGHERLARLGTSFTNHRVSTTMCTSSRSVMLTGLQTIDNGMFENVDTPFVGNLSTKIPTYGHMLRQAGYYTAYKGKWHLNREFENPGPNVDLNAEMEKYGFSDFYSPGDKLAHALGGYRYDHQIGGGAVSWLRSKGCELNDQGTPWSLTVSLINPHDIMYFNADAPGENVQDNGKLLMHAARAPEHAFYKNKWNYPLPKNLTQSMDDTGRPKAHGEFLKSWGYCLGNIPLKTANWERFTNFYLNSIRSVDAQINSILNELENLGLAENTVVVFTSDHGEMAGSHGLRGKGPFAYREATHVPFYVIHPDVRGGQKCKALTSHIDLVPTMLGFAGLTRADYAKLAGRDLPGKDMSSALTRPSAADLHTVRDSSLFIYSGIATTDSEVVRIISEAKASGKDPKRAIKESGYKPNLKKRGSLRSVFDGRYVFTRYFAPVERNSPKSLTDLFAHNDVELYDLKNDPSEMKNLAIDQKANSEILLTMNTKLESVIAAEMGKDDGREMPKLEGIDWSLDRMDL